MRPWLPEVWPYLLYGILAVAVIVNGIASH